MGMMRLTPSHNDIHNHKQFLGKSEQHSVKTLGNLSNLSAPLIEWLDKESWQGASVNTEDTCRKLANLTTATVIPCTFTPLDLSTFYVCMQSL